MPTNNMTLNQVLPLKELEAAGVLKLDHSQPQPTPMTPSLPKMETRPQQLTFPTPVLNKPVATSSIGDATNAAISLIDPNNSTFVKEEAEDVSEVFENADGTFSVAFKGPNNEMQHIQIIRPSGLKGDMMLELTNTQTRRPSTKGTKINECDICGKILSSSTNLIRHKMYHSSERPFVCQTCGKGFKDISNLKKHTMIHNRIFPCHLCKKSFLRKSLLTMHLKRHESHTVFVKTGTGAKEVLLKTFVDSDGTRVEEMSMAALQGQVFEYKKRIMKADPSVIVKSEQIKKEIESEGDKEIEKNPTTLDANQNNAESNGQAKFILTEEGLVEDTSAAAEKEKDNGAAEDDGNDEESQALPKNFFKMYQCGHCGKRTIQRGNMMRHLIHHLKDKPFKCEECPKEFVDKGELVKHMKTHTKPYRCNQCNGAFAHNVQLLKHQESDCLGGDDGPLNYTRLDDGLTYRCDICMIEMKRLGNMIKHVGTHSNIKSKGRRKSSKRLPIKTTSITAPYSYNAIARKFQCNFCPEIFVEKKIVHQHLKNEHSDKTVYPCTHCDSWFHSNEELKKHEESVHEKPFKCSVCSLTFAHKIQLESHKRKHEEKDTAEETADYGKSDMGYYCKHCGKKLFSKFRMMNHIRKHLDDRQFECFDCNKCFKARYMLSTHRKIHAKLFTCENCGEAFTRKLFLQLHRKKHEGSIDLTEEDNFEVNNKRKLSQDLENAPEGDSFACRICSQVFNREVIKLNHERKCKEEHKVMTKLIGNNGYQCKICTKVASLKHNLMVHIKRHHSDVVKIDPNGEIEVPEIYLQDFQDIVLEDESYVAPELKRPKLSAASSVREKNGNNTEDNEKNVYEDDDFDEEDERYTKVPGGFACNKCRTKLSDVNSILDHLKTHVSQKFEMVSETEKEAASSLQAVAEEIWNAVELGEQEQLLIKVAQDSSIPIDSTSEVEQEKSLEDNAVVQAETNVTIADVQILEGSSKGMKIETKSPSVVKKETKFNPQIPRSSSRPARSQRVPSRFLE